MKAQPRFYPVLSWVGMPIAVSVLLLVLVPEVLQTPTVSAVRVLEDVSRQGSQQLDVLGGMEQAEWSDQQAPALYTDPAAADAAEQSARPIQRVLVEPTQQVPDQELVLAVPAAAAEPLAKPAAMAGAEGPPAGQAPLVHEEQAATAQPAQDAVATTDATSGKPASPECSNQGVMEGGRCICRPGHGGPTCSFSQSSVFLDQDIYASLNSSDRLRPLDLQGWTNGDESKYSEFMERADAVTVIEVGVWKGASASLMARWLRNRGRGVVVAVDTWLGAPEFWQNGAQNSAERSMFLVNGWPTVYYSFLSNVVHQGLQDYIVPLPQPSKLATVFFRRLGVTADLVHIDAAHEYGSVKEDIHLWWPFVRHGGLLLGDDYNDAWPSVRKAAQEFALVCELKLEVDGYKWMIQKPEKAWFDSMAHLPVQCLRGAYEHY